MRFLNGLDLNLLVSLDALLRTQSVTESARILHVSQPAMSASLHRLRAHFSDEILMKVGRSLVLTPTGAALKSRVPQLLVAMQDALEGAVNFDPNTCDAEITVASSDHHLRSWISALCIRLEAQAPFIKLRIVPNTTTSAVEILRDEVDFVISPALESHPDVKNQLLLSDEIVAVAWKEAEFDATLDEIFGRRRHVVARYGATPGSDQRVLDRLGIKRRVDIVLSSPSMIAAALIGTQRVALLPKQLAVAQASYLPIRTMPLPVELPALQVKLGWHVLKDNVPHLIWFRSLLLDLGSKLLGASDS